MRFWRVLIATLALLVAAYGVLALSNRTGEAHPYYARFGGAPVILAHGGGQGLWPDNTMLAFEGAAALGADVLELDVRRDQDGTFRVIHDATLDRTTSGTGPVAALPGARVDALDAGYHWTPGGPRAGAQEADYRYRGAGATVPTLAAVLERFPEASVNVEIKEREAGAGTALCSLLRSHGALERVLVASFNSEPMRAFRKACPEVATSATRSEVTLFFVLATARLSAVYRPPFEAMQVPVKQGSITVVTPRFVRAAHARGLAVEVWTVNDPAEMARLEALGVDGLITDRPDRALALVGRPYAADLVPDFVAP